MVGGDEAIPAALVSVERMKYLPVLVRRQAPVDVTDGDALDIVLEVLLERRDDRLREVLVEREEMRHGRAGQAARARSG